MVWPESPHSPGSACPSLHTSLWDTQTQKYWGSVTQWKNQRLDFWKQMSTSKACDRKVSRLITIFTEPFSFCTWTHLGKMKAILIQEDIGQLNSSHVRGTGRPWLILSRTHYITSTTSLSLKGARTSLLKHFTSDTTVLYIRNTFFT